MTHSRVIYLPELLNHILHFLAIDKSLYPTLFVCRLWYRCGVSVLWKRVELKNSNIRKIFMKTISEKQKSLLGTKPFYYLNVTHLEIPSYWRLSDKKFKHITHLFPNIIHLNLNNSTGFSDKTLNRIAESYPNLKYLNLGIYYHERKDDTGLITDKGLYAIANSCYKLEYLDISFRIEFSEESICNIIHSCLKLQALHIHGCRITYKTIRETRLYLKLKYFGLSRGWNRSNYS